MKLRCENHRAAHGLTLIETVVAASVGSLVLLVVTMLSVYALRSFGAMGNYAILDARNRIAVDRMTRDIRQANCVSNYYSDATVRWIQFVTPLAEAKSVKYLWYPDDRTVICSKDGQEEIYLTDCDEWNFTLYQRSPLTNSPDTFALAQDPAGNPNAATCKMVELNWKCSRSMIGKKLNSESVQSVRVVLRNKN